MTPEHGMRDDCREMRTEFHKMKEDYGNPKDGIIASVKKDIVDGLRRLHGRCDSLEKSKISLRVLGLFIGVLLIISAGTDTYIAVSGNKGEQKVVKLEEQVDKVQYIQGQVLKTLENIDENMSDAKDRQEKMDEKLDRLLEK